jgi:putative acetyltransferase
MLSIARTTEDNQDFLDLVKLLDIELAQRDGDDHSFYAQFNKPVGLTGVVLVLDDGVAVGCGAFKEYSTDVAEVKRMYVKPEARGKRIAALILTELESWASSIGFQECILETGFKQPEAIALYKREGYETIPNYGQYAEVASSICMRKEFA